MTGKWVAARATARRMRGWAVLVILGLLVGGFVVYVESRPWFDGWWNIYLDAREVQ